MAATLSPSVRRTKRATGNDVPFENALSDLGFAHLRNKAPMLLDYAVGFQLLDRNEEEQKGAGVFVFKIGSQWLYAPVFFIDGDIRGYELLYLKNQDMFVPLKENWITYLINKRPQSLGEGVERTPSRLGISNPDLTRLADPPSKFAAALPDWVRQGLPGLAKAAVSDPFAGWQPQLPELIKAGGMPFLRTLLKVAEHYPFIARALDEFYTQAEIKQAVEAVRRALKPRSVLEDPLPYKVTQPEHKKSVMAEFLPQHPCKTGELSVITYNQDIDQPSGLVEMDEEQQEKLLRDGVLIKDHRKGDQVSVAYAVDGEKQLTNPTESGLYDVLVRPGQFEKCVVLMHPHSSRKREGFATIFRASAEDGSRNWLNTHPTYIWVGKQYVGDEWRDWFNAQSDATSFTRSYDQYVILDAKGTGTLPFHVEQELASGEEDKGYDVNFATHASKRRSAYSLGTKDRDYWQDSEGPSSSYGHGERLHLQGRDGTRMRVVNGDLFVPKGCKKVLVKKRKAPSWWNDDDMRVMDASSGDGDPPPIEPGNAVDLEIGIHKASATLKIWNDGLEVELNSRRMPAKAAFVSLIRDHGFTEGVARAMLKEAQQAWIGGRRALQYHVKYASPFLTEQGPSAPNFPEPSMGADSFMGSSAPAMFPQSQELAVPGMESNPADREMYDPTTPNSGNEQLLQAVQQASQTGQREIFDTAMVGSLLRVHRDDMLVDRYLGPVMKGMDAIGRLLLSFYWNRDQFEERYGKQDMSELEDSLRTTFDQNGELALFLKQKTIEPDNAAKIDLSRLNN